MKDAKGWISEIQKNKSFAKKYKGLNNVKSILEQAKKDGYNVNKEDLKNVDLKKIAGGLLSIISDSQKASVNVYAKGDHAEAEFSGNIDMRIEHKYSDNNYKGNNYKG